MLRTNSKIYLDRIEQYIIDCIDLEFEYNYTRDQKRRIQLKYAWERFNSEHNFENNKKRYPNHQDRLADWLQGAPSAVSIDFENYRILEIAADLHNEPKLEERIEDMILENWYNHIALHLLRLFDKYNVETNW